MNTRRFFTVAMVIVLCCTAVVFAGCRQEADTQQGTTTDEQAVAGESGASSTPDTVTVTDVLGREVTVTLPVESVAFTHYATPEVLRILNAWDLGVARGPYSFDSSMHPNFDELPDLGGVYDPNMELLLDINPDLLVLELVPGPGLPELIEALEGIIPVVVLKTFDPDTMTAGFETLGQLLDREKEATEYIDWNLDIRNSLLEKTANLQETEKPRIFYHNAWGRDGIGTLTDSFDYVSTRNRITGCINIAGDLPAQDGWIPTLDQEWLASQDFDVLFIGDGMPGSYGITVEDNSAIVAERERIMGNPVFAETSAVRNDRVFMQSDVFLGTPRTIIGYAYLAKWFHPDLFQDLDPQALHQEYLTRFIGVDVDLTKTGVFVYPEE